MGVVHAPLISSSMTSLDSKTGGFWATWAKGNLGTEKNFETLKTNNNTKKILLVSTSLSSQRLESVKSKVSNEFEVVQCASIATRLALVATGDAAATITFHGLNPWDFAAGQALMIGRGANLYDLSIKTSLNPVLWKDLHPSTFPSSYVAATNPQVISLLQEQLN